MNLAIPYIMLLRNEKTTRIIVTLALVVAVLTSISATYNAITQKMTRIEKKPAAAAIQLEYLGRAEIRSAEQSLTAPVIRGQGEEWHIGCMLEKRLKGRVYTASFAGKKIAHFELEKCRNDVRDYSLLAPENTPSRRNNMLSVYTSPPIGEVVESVELGMDGLYTVWLILAYAAAFLAAYTSRSQIRDALSQDLAAMEVSTGPRNPAVALWTANIYAATMAATAGTLLGHLGASATTQLLSAIGYTSLTPTITPSTYAYTLAVMLAAAIIPERVKTA